MKSSPTIAPVATDSPPNPARAVLLIARRGAIESLRDRSTASMGVFFSLILPVVLVLTTIRPSAHDKGLAGATLAAYLLIVGLLPSSAAVGSAAGQFAGEFEQGSLTPLLATPVSNAAIFGGKVLGAVLPAMLFAVVAVASYLAMLAVTVSNGVGRLPVPLTIAMLAFVPVVAVFAASVASLISSRVRTYNTAQQLAGFALTPLWGAVGILAFIARDWSPWLLAAVVAALVAVDIVLVLLAAATWRREEVLARR
jgi:ABC-type Na+ efflux pump permease subunit